MRRLIILALTCPLAAQANSFHVATMAEFQQALVDASLNSEDDTIFVKSGYYAVSGTPLTYAPGSGAPFGEDNHALTISGLCKHKHEDGRGSEAKAGRKGTLADSYSGADENAAHSAPRPCRNPPTLDGQGASRILAIDTTGVAGPGSIRITIEGLRFRNGHADRGGALLLEIYRTTVDLMNSEFEFNDATGDGGAVFAQSSSSGVGYSNNVFKFNASSGNGGAVFTRMGDGGNLYQNNVFLNNVAGGIGGGVYASAINGTTMIHNEFVGNKAWRGGGAGAYGEYSLRLSGNLFRYNAASEDGGGAFARSDEGGCTLTDNVFEGNRAGNRGGGLAARAFYHVYLTNNTAFFNTAASQGGGVFVDKYISLRTHVYNNILWANRAKSGGHDGDDLFVLRGDESGRFPGAELFNNILGLHADVVSADSEDLVVTGTNNYVQGFNILANPLLRRGAHLRARSPAIDAGDNAAPRLSTEDFESDPRIIDGNGNGTAIVDIGADEFVDRHR